jgi:hypothetical protein
MKVTLAYAYEGHKPDDTIEVDDLAGRTLLREGNARAADAASRKAAADVTGDTDSAHPTSRPTRHTTEKKG